MANEPAFPVQDCAAYQYPGMTLRDWFAGQAMAGVLGARMNSASKVALEAYILADAMLAEREKNDAQ